ncbi:hypothetical protein BCR36DRAFT_322425 [Piromyces finnis]|uniref:Cilia- and flagella-associated protein 418 n=1 Tax=Piromyces finnis TaxID=1754191 RepID=A0A1Y1VG40_9FUNG|nr:hypothetical protein BCR36DRAFT_322425 [Piromyces finnis]|eukprot:ORX54161.1 hypothetical protein BCR36DRAFT_322425 [Piromyces finnis]
MASLIKSDMEDDIEYLLKELELEQDTLPNPPKSYKNKSYNINTGISKYNNDKTDTYQNNTTTDEINDILKELSSFDTAIPNNNILDLKPASKYKFDKKEIAIERKASYTSNNTTNSQSSKLAIKDNTHNSSTSHHKAKCTTVCIGGPEGITIGNNKKSCSKLRCTSCDFNCMYFKDYEWSNKVNYLFFRNYVPNINKLSKELIPKKGSTSICCQCTWYTTNQTIPISSLKDKKIKWVCGGHSMN